MAGASASPAWYANVNPLIVVLLVNFITHLMRNKKATTSINIGMVIIPVSALVMATGNIIGGENILGFHPIAFMMIIGICLQALAETFISPRYFEYFSLQSPKGEEGLYLGFSHLHSFVSSILGFGISGFLLDKYCPNPANFANIADWQAASVHAHYIWYWFAVIGAVSAIAFYIFVKITNRIDKKKASKIE
jgi:hypothetical protein